MTLESLNYTFILQEWLTFYSGFLKTGVSITPRSLRAIFFLSPANRRIEWPPVGLSWQTVFKSKIQKPSFDLLSLSLISVWKRWFMLDSLSPSTTRYNVYRFVFLWDMILVFRGQVMEICPERRKRRKLWVRLSWLWLRDSLSSYERLVTSTSWFEEEQQHHLVNILNIMLLFW